MKKIVILTLLAIISSQILSQTINQPGEVRSISYQLGIKGTPIADVRIKSLVEVRSDSNGKFVLPVSADGKDYFTFTDIYLTGYELVIPSMNEFRTRRFAINPSVSHTIVMVNRNERNAETNRIAEQLRRKNEEEIEQRENQIAMLNTELKALREQNRNANDLERQVDNLQSELQQFRQTYYTSDELIRKEAERLSKIDFYELDSLQAVIVNLLKEGRGEEVVQTARSQISDELWNKIMADPGSIKQELEQKTQLVEQLTRALQQDSLLLEQLAQQLKNMADGFASDFKNDSAAFYLKKKMELDLENLDFTLEYAGYISKYLALYDDALRLNILCLEKSRSRFGEESLEFALYSNQIGLVYTELGNYPMALDYYEKSLAIWLKVLGPEHPDVATSYNNIGFVYYSQGNYHTALEYYEKSLAICLKVFGAEHPDVATSYNNIATVYSNQSDYPKALEYYEKSLAIWLNIFGAEHRDVATSYNNIGNNYYNQSDYHKALEYCEKALAIRLKVLGFEHPDVATSFNSIAVAYSNLGDYSKALVYHEKALAIRLKVFGSEHSDVAYSFHNIGAVYNNQGDYPKALVNNEKALAIRLKALGTEHPDVADSYNNIGFVYNAYGDYPKAVEFYEKSLAILLKVLGAEHPSVATSYNNIGGVYNLQGEYPKALEYYEKSLAICLEVLGAEHPDVSTTYNNIGSLYDSQGNYPKALEYYEKSLSIWLKVFGENNSDVLNTKVIMSDLRTLSVSHQFMFDVVENGVAYSKGLRGKYIVLFYEGWEMGEQNNMFNHNPKVRDIAKRIVVLNDEGIHEYHFEPGLMGMSISIEAISEDEEKRILEMYEEWKKGR